MHWNARNGKREDKKMGMPNPMVCAIHDFSTCLLVGEGKCT